MSLCCDAEIDDNGNVTGEPTEAALVTYSYTVATRKTNSFRNIRVSAKLRSTP